jgi:hypothetical protein
MTAILLALTSSRAYGAADFLGGVAARGTHVLRVVVIAAPSAASPPPIKPKHLLGDSGSTSSHSRPSADSHGNLGRRPGRDRWLARQGGGSAHPPESIVAAAAERFVVHTARTDHQLALLAP